MANYDKKPKWGAKKEHSKAPDVEKSDKVRYSAEQIKNGWIVEKSWTDKDGMYQCEKVYHEKNPFEGNPMKG